MLSERRGRPVPKRLPRGEANAEVRDAVQWVNARRKSRSASKSPAEWSRSPARSPSLGTPRVAGSTEQQPSPEAYRQGWLKKSSPDASLDRATAIHLRTPLEGDTKRLVVQNARLRREIETLKEAMVRVYSISEAEMQQAITCVKHTSSNGDAARRPPHLPPNLTRSMSMALTLSGRLRTADKPCATTERKLGVEGQSVEELETALAHSLSTIESMVAERAHVSSHALRTAQRKIQELEASLLMKEEQVTALLSSEFFPEQQQSPTASGGGPPAQSANPTPRSDR